MEAVAGSPTPLRLADVATSVGLHRATCHRILADLVSRGWVLRAGDRYLPGVVLLGLADGRRANALIRIAHDVILDLSVASGLMVNLQVLEGEGTRVVDVVRPDRLAMIEDLDGQRLGLGEFSGPTALVAALPPQAREPYVEAAVRRGADRGDLEGELARTESTGFAGGDKLHGVVASMSKAVVLDPERAPLAAITLVGLAADLTDERLAASLSGACARLADLLRGAWA